MKDPTSGSVSIKIVKRDKSKDEEVLDEVTALVAVQQKRGEDEQALHFPMVHGLMLVREWAHSSIHPSFIHFRCIKTKSHAYIIMELIKGCFCSTYST